MTPNRSGRDGSMKYKLGGQETGSILTSDTLSVGVTPLSLRSSASHWLHVGDPLRWQARWGEVNTTLLTPG